MPLPDENDYWLRYAGEAEIVDMADRDGSAEDDRTTALQDERYLVVRIIPRSL